MLPAEPHAVDVEATERFVIMLPLDERRTPNILARDENRWTLHVNQYLRHDMNSLRRLRKSISAGDVACNQHWARVRVRVTICRD